MWSFTRPNSERLRRLLDSQEAAGLTYPEVGVSASGSLPGYDVDDNRILLGQGPTDFATACEALRAWKQFPSPWTQIWPLPMPIAEGRTIALVAHTFGMWWVNTCRIVTVVDEPTRFGFAYGTLPLHVERGEERFMVELLADGGVWYSIRAVSRPRYWMTRMAYRMARRMQKKFARESLAAMKAIVETPLLAEGVR